MTGPTLAQERVGRFNLVPDLYRRQAGTAKAVLSNPGVVWFTNG